ncbi:hypothetical protein BJI48_01475 [Helicobacter sp. 11S02596-1]|nr:hypothetical protein BJI48_01475 [Helicobacter sp. 11S02596-1]
MVNIITRSNPKDSAHITLKGNTYEFKNTLSGNLSLSLGKKITEKFFLKANAGFSDGGGYGKFSKQRNATQGLQAIYQFTPNQTLDLNASYARTNVLVPDQLSLAELQTDRRGASSLRRFTDTFQAYWADYRAKAGVWDFDMLGFFESSDQTDEYLSLAGTKTYGGEFVSLQSGLSFKSKRQTQNNTLMLGYDLSYSNSALGEDKAARLANSIYFLERYAFVHWFDLSAGARYENSYYELKKSASKFKGDKDFHSYAIEVTPNFKYSPTGNVYAKYERGFVAPLPEHLVATNADKQTIVGPIHPQTYDTYELGWKDEFAWSYLSATLFYTQAVGEFNFNYVYSSNHMVGAEYYNVGDTRRIGVEINGMQDFFDRLHIGESISYVDATIIKDKDPSEKNKKVPYTNLYKITLNIGYDTIKSQKNLLNVFFNTSFFGQREDNQHNKMDAYILSDLGMTYTAKRSGASLSAGVRNVFNALYIDYAYGTKRGTTYLPAPERSYYAEISFRF